MAPPHIPNTMFAWRKHRDSEEPIWEEVPVPPVPPTGFLCKILAAGVCHSDHALLVDKQPPRPWFQEKFTLSHEGCGEIIAIGDKVTRTEFKIGDRIAMLAVPGCGQEDCTQCLTGVPLLCARGHHSGIGNDGFFAPCATIDQRGAIAVPDDVSSPEAAAATDAVTTAYHAIARRAKVKKSETVFIFGLAKLGFNGLQVTRAIGARVIVSDVRQERLDAARALGVPEGDIVPIGKSVQDFVKEKEDLQIDTTIDFVGMEQTFADAQQIVRIAGKVICVGTLSLHNTVDMKNGIRKRVTILFSYGGQVEDLEEVLGMISRGEMRPQVETGKLKDFPRWLKDLCDGKVKARVALLPEG